MNAFPTHRFWLGWTLLHAAVMTGTHSALGVMKSANTPATTAFVGCLVLALLQPMALRGQVRHLWVWPVLSVLGICGSVAFTWFMLLWLGACVAALQWPVFALGGFHRAWLWPAFGAAGWGLGGLVGYLQAALLFPERADQGSSFWEECIGLTILGLSYGASTGYALVLMRPTPTAPAGTLYWDADCPFCIRWVGRLAFVARQGGFALVPMQSEEARRDLGLREGELPAEMKLRLADGRLLGGLDAFITMAEAAGWTALLGWFLRVPGINALAWRSYRWVARNRHCLDGSCAFPPAERRRV